MIGAIHDLIILVGQETLGNYLLNHLGVEQQKDLIDDVIRQSILDVDDITADIMDVWSEHRMNKAEVSLILSGMARELFESEEFDTPHIAAQYEALNQAIRRLR